MPSMSLPAKAEPPRIAASTTPSLGRNRRNAPSMPSSVTALAYLCAYGMHGKNVKSGYGRGFRTCCARPRAIRSWVVHMKVRDALVVRVVEHVDHRTGVLEAHLLLGAPSPPTCG